MGSAVDGCSCSASSGNSAMTSSEPDDPASDKGRAVELRSKGITDEERGGVEDEGWFGRWSRPWERRSGRVNGLPARSIRIGKTNICIHPTHTHS